MAGELMTEDVRRRAVSIALERGCRDAARLLEEGHRFPRLVSSMRPVERRAWMALISSRRERS